MSFHSYGFEIVGSADKANKAIDSTLENLDRIAPQALRASQQIQTAMDRAAEYVRKLNAALDRPRGQGVTEGALRTAQAYQKLAQQEAAYIEQLRREQQMLEAIRGPMQQAYQDIATLNSLLAKGAINAQEFNNKLAKIRAPQAVKGGGGGGFDVASIAGSLPGGSLVAGAVGGGVGGAATAAAQMAIGGAGEVIAMADAYQSLQQRLKNVTGSSQGAAEAFAQVKDIATLTRADLNATTEAFLRITGATKSMGLTQSQVVAFTRQLNEDIAMSGAATESAKAGMLQLTQALASGVLRGDEFNSIMENIPTVADTIAAHLRVSRGELRAMAEDGKLTAKVIYDSYAEAGGRIDAAFAKSIPTISQQFTLLKNEVFVTVGELGQMVNVSKIAGEVVKDFSTIITATAEQTKLWGEVLGVSGLQLSDFAGGGAGGLRALADFFRDADFSAEGFRRAMTGTTVATSKYGDVVRDVFSRQIAESSGKMNDFAKEQARATIEMRLGKAAAEAFAKSLGTVASGWDIAKPPNAIAEAFGIVENAVLNAGRAIRKVNDDNRREIVRQKQQIDILADIRRRLAAEKAANEMSQDYRDAQAFKKMDKRGEDEWTEKEKEWLKLENEREKDAEKAAKQVADAEANAAKANERNARERAQAIAQAVTPLSDALIDGLNDGKLAWREWADTAIREIEKTIAKMLILKAIEAATGAPVGAVGGGTGLLGALLGGLGGGSAGANAPGFASGGDFMMRGASQGSDDHLVMWWMSAGETASIRTPEQRRQAAKESNTDGITITPEIKVLPAPERRDIVDNSRNGLSVLAKLDRRARRRD